MPTFAALCDLRKCAGHAASSRIAQNVDIDLGGNHGRDKFMQRCGIARDFRFKLKSFAHRHDRDAVHGNRSADDDFVATVARAG